MVITTKIQDIKQQVNRYDNKIDTFDKPGLSKISDDKYRTGPIVSKVKKPSLLKAKTNIKTKVIKKISEQEIVAPATGLQFLRPKSKRMAPSPHVVMKGKRSSKTSEKPMNQVNSFPFPHMKLSKVEENVKYDGTSLPIIESYNRTVDTPKKTKATNKPAAKIKKTVADSTKTGKTVQEELDKVLMEHYASIRSKMTTEWPMNTPETSKLQTNKPQVSKQQASKPQARPPSRLAKKPRKAQAARPAKPLVRTKKLINLKSVRALSSASSRSARAFGSAETILVSPEIKHNDSIVISARQMLRRSVAPREPQPEFLQLNKKPPVRKTATSAAAAALNAAFTAAAEAGTVSDAGNQQSKATKKKTKPRPKVKKAARTKPAKEQKS